MQDSEDPSPAAPTVEQAAETVFSGVLGTMQTLSIHLGDRLGWYRALADRGPLTAGELAEASATDARYAREWLEQQAVFGLLRTADASAQPDERRFELDAAFAEVLADEHSLAYLAPLARAAAAAAVRMPELVTAYRTGAGVGWAAFGTDMREAQSDTNRPWFERLLAERLTEVPELAERLRRPGVRIAEIGFGGGWASIALARAFPQAVIVGVDVDEASVDLARRNAAEAGLADRIDLRRASGAELATDDPFDLVFAFECVHDLAQPVEVLGAARAALRPDGLMVVMDEHTDEVFAAPADELQRVFYGFSILVCLPDGRSSTPSAATGTVMRPAQLEQYARAAGFAATEVLPIEDFSAFRFYALRP